VDLTQSTPPFDSLSVGISRVFPRGKWGTWKRSLVYDRCDSPLCDSRSSIVSTRIYAIAVSPNVIIVLSIISPYSGAVILGSRTGAFHVPTQPRAISI
jgi:hypothetical protein